MSNTWLGNIRIPPETLRDLSDQEWYDQLIAKHGADKVHIGPPQAAAGMSAKEWDERGMMGLYLSE